MRLTVASERATGNLCFAELESKKDEDLTLGEIQAYARVTDQRTGLAVGKPLTPV